MSTTPTAKGYDVTQIHQGPGDIWIIGNPPTDTAQRITLDLPTGTPDSTAHPSSICLGLSKGGINGTIKTKVVDIVADQADAPVDAFLDAIEANIEAELEQQGVTLLQNALSVGVFSTLASPGYNQLTFGGINIVPSVCVACISPKRTGSNLWLVTMLYKAVAKGPLTIMMERNKASTHKVQFTGMADLTRTAGRQIGVQYETL